MNVLDWKTDVTVLVGDEVSSSIVLIQTSVLLNRRSSVQRTTTRNLVITISGLYFQDRKGEPVVCICILAIVSYPIDCQRVKEKTRKQR